MLVLVFILTLFLVLGPQAVQSRFNTISFSSVEQCGSFSLNFSGGKPPSSLPLTLTVVPFNSTPISIIIPSFSWNSTTATGAAVTFLPLPAGAEFVASLDDALGRPTGLVSDVIAVEPSTNASCLLAAPPTPRYTLPDVGAFTQCSPFNISYQPGVVDVPPTIRAFVPKNESVLVNLVAAEGSGQATYTMDAAQGERVVLMLSDDTGFHQSSDLFVVNGDNSSSMGCLPAFKTMVSSPDNSDGSPVSTGGISKYVYSPCLIMIPHLLHAVRKLSRSAVIAIAIVIPVVVVGIAVAMALWVYRYRRKARTVAESFGGPRPQDPEVWGASIKKTEDPHLFGPPLPEKQCSIRPLSEPRLAALRTEGSDKFTQVVRDRTSIGSSISSSSQRSMSPHQPGSFPVAPKLPSLPTSPFNPRAKQSVSRTVSQRTRSTRNPTSVSSADIEYMIEIGTVYSPNLTRTSLQSYAETNAAASVASNVTTGAFKLAAPAPSVVAARDYDRPLPSPPASAFLSPSVVRDSDGLVVTSTYDPSNWVSRSIPPTPVTSRSSHSQSLPSASSYRSPPHALVPSSPISAISAAPDPPMLVAGSRQTYQ
ncbi:hypothetical protein EIP91_001774 [Steccherinum ochraceum]|uniref:Uncharacterized protein n=1 Tax=Steccherinum ochraceum TaxID=92696 RepID=A0A4R0RVK9_9APHY|nr:hypothetical protein EIP91_001774 [Steccherinum ochraceum]